jgi:hypothetical protein
MRSGAEQTLKAGAVDASFTEPDGNGWLLQEVAARLPGPVDTDVRALTSPTELRRALRRAAAGKLRRDKGRDERGWSTSNASAIHII